MEYFGKKVVNVYRGKDGVCMCGCRGKYFYTEEGAVEANPGYDVSGQVNEKAVKTVLNKILKAENRVEEDGCVYAVIKDRILVAYFA